MKASDEISRGITFWITVCVLRYEQVISGTRECTEHLRLVDH